jgi:hypothetical protein
MPQSGSFVVLDAGHGGHRIPARPRRGHGVMIRVRYINVRLWAEAIGSDDMKLAVVVEKE